MSNDDDGTCRPFKTTLLDGPVPGPPQGVYVRTTSGSEVGMEVSSRGGTVDVVPMDTDDDDLPPLAPDDLRNLAPHDRDWETGGSS